MKNLFLTMVMILIIGIAKPQAVLEHIYQGDLAYAVKLQNYGWVYYTVNFVSPGNDVNIFNDSHNLIKTVHLQIPTGYVNPWIYNISDVLFNSDSKIEILYSLFSTSTGYPMMLLINEDGVILQSFPKLWYVTFSHQEENFKMLGVTQEDSSTYVYSLPGTMLDFSGESVDTEKSKVYPDPSKNNINIIYPIGYTSISIFNINGDQLITNLLDKSGQTQISTVNLGDGTYVYKLFSLTKPTLTGKFVTLK
jgi:hypothetical protein